MANSKDGQGYKDKYIDTSRKITRNVHVQYGSSNIYYLEVMTNVNLKENKGQMSRSKGLVLTKRSYHKEYS